MQYFIFMDHMLARRDDELKYEWFINGNWSENARMTLNLMDAINGYGDYSIGDQDQITEETAEELIRTGTVILEGDIGYGTFYKEPKIIRLNISGNS